MQASGNRLILPWGNNGNPASVSLCQGCTVMPGSRNRRVENGQQNLQKAESHVLSIQDNLKREF